MSTLQIFSKRLRKARKSKFPSQDGLAEALDVHLLTVGRWERGERLPGPEDLDRIVEVLEKPVGWFFDDGSLAQEGAHVPSDSISAIRSHLDRLERALENHSVQPSEDNLPGLDEESQGAIKESLSDRSESVREGGELEPGKRPVKKGSPKGAGQT